MDNFGGILQNKQQKGKTVDVTKKIWKTGSTD